MGELAALGNIHSGLNTIAVKGCKFNDLKLLPIPDDPFKNSRGCVIRKQKCSRLEYSETMALVVKLKHQHPFKRIGDTLLNSTVKSGTLWVCEGSHSS